MLPSQAWKKGACHCDVHIVMLQKLALVRGVAADDLVTARATASCPRFFAPPIPPASFPRLVAPPLPSASSLRLALSASSLNPALRLFPPPRSPPLPSSSLSASSLRLIAPPLPPPPPLHGFSPVPARPSFVPACSARSLCHRMTPAPPVPWSAIR
ncbi:hypothetical protein AB1Y20_021802 [Prymnesium parvum]|uniref:Uncharacterized protein n=1 Tax=Prymnesium parvum TaxID=97485 RepID=A0AB34JMA6_PRYPA